MFDRSRARESIENAHELLCLAIRAEFTQMRRERDRDALERGEKFLEVQVGQLEGFGHDDRFVLDTIGAVHEISRIELEQAGD